MIIPKEQLSDEMREVFANTSPEDLKSHVGDCINMIFFKDGRTMNAFYRKVGKYSVFMKMLGPQKRNVHQSAITGRFYVVFYSPADYPIMRPGYEVTMNGVEMKSLMLYP